MTFPTAPIGWFDVLLERDDDRGGTGLPDAFRAVYGGDWRLPESAEPYVCVNFCT